MSHSRASASRLDLTALLLRVGLGAVFVIGGSSKLSQLLDPSRADAIVASYMGPTGYINAFFASFLFDSWLGTILTPWNFLTLLSGFELVSGVLLIAGLLVRPLALLYGFMLWSFVFALPVVTTPGVETTVVTYTSPALLVQARDVALSGLMFALFNLGAGARLRLGGVAPGDDRERPSWDAMALLVRLSVALPLLVGGCFAGRDHIQSFATFAPILVVLGVVLISGRGVRIAAVAITAVMLWYMSTRLSLDQSMIANLNGFKREFAFIGAAGVLMLFGGGERFAWHFDPRRARVATAS